MKGTSISWSRQRRALTDGHGVGWDPAGMSLPRKMRSLQGGEAEVCSHHCLVRGLL